jgi:small subunit ribosomal protein S16
MDSRKRRDGKVIENVGTYAPTFSPSKIEVKSDRVQYWLSQGAQVSDPVKVLIKLSGDWQKFHGEKDAPNNILPQNPPEDLAEVLKKVDQDVAKAQANASPIEIVLEKSSDEDASSDAAGKATDSDKATSEESSAATDSDSTKDTSADASSDSAASATKE